MNASKAGRIALSILFSFVASVVAFLLIAVTPFFMEEHWYGVQSVYESPAHGGAIFLLTVPLAGFVSIPMVVFLSFWIYRKWLSKPSANQ